MLEVKKKQQIIKKFQTHAGDTGSSEVQIAILTAEIEELIEHLKGHHKDHSSRRGLLHKVSARRRLMRYLKKDNPESYEIIAKKLKIKQPRAIAKLDTSSEEVAGIEDLGEVDIVEEKDGIKE